MDGQRIAMRASVAVWSRVLLVVAIATLVTGVARAQAPPSSFFDGRSNEELRAMASNPHNDVLLRRTAASRLVMTLSDAGELDAADTAAREFAKNIDPRAVKHAKAVRRRRHVHVVAVAALVVALGIVAVSLAAVGGALRTAVGAVRRSAPVVVLFAAYAGLAGGYLASRYENSSSLPFVLFAGFMLPLLVIFRAWSAVGSPRPAARVGRGLAAVAATLAVGFLVVEHVNPTYLEGFGL